MKKIIDEIIERLEDTLEISEDDYVDIPSYESIKINKNKFNKIEKQKTINRKISFVDGGNAEIIKASNFSLQFIRVYYNVFKDSKKVKAKRYEFFVLVKAVDKGGIKYKTEFFGDLKLDLSFDSFDKSLREGEHRVSVSKIGEIVRRFLELEVSSMVLNELDEGDVLVMDRDLEVNVTNEDGFFDRLYENAFRKKVIVCGLSKTTNLLTKRGNNANSLLNSLGKGFWYYKLIDGIYFVKLNEKSKYCFRFDISSKVDYDINEVLSLLMENSKDPVFIGYPYALVMADKFARVSNNEKNYLRTMFMTKFGKNWKKIEKYETSLDAHDVLDRVT